MRACVAEADYLARIEAARGDGEALWLIAQELQGLREPLQAVI